jgi:hypothetical protein
MRLCHVPIFFRLYRSISGLQPVRIADFATVVVAGPLYLMLMIVFFFNNNQAALLIVYSSFDVTAVDPVDSVCEYLPLHIRLAH